MGRIDEEREIRLRPPTPRIQRNQDAAWSNGFKLLMHYARSTRKTGNRGTYCGKRKSARSYHQRCAVRVTYVNNQARGQWKAHGRYLARESATVENDRGPRDSVGRIKESILHRGLKTGRGQAMNCCGS